MSSEETVAPSHHFSSIDTWKHPDRSYFHFVVLSVLVGFFGIDHFYLRSFGTGFQKMIINMLGFGIWYFWDLVQLYADGDKVIEHGLDSPFEWIRGIGRGVFVNPLQQVHNVMNPLADITRTKHDLFMYAMLAIFFGAFGADRFYMGNTEQGLAKLASVWFFLTTIFGLVWVIWDICRVLFFTQSVLEDGITSPLPFSLWNDPIPGSSFIPERVSKAQIAKELFETGQQWSLDATRNSKYLMWNWDIWFWNWSLFRSMTGARVPLRRGGGEDFDGGAKLPRSPKMPSMPSSPSVPSVPKLEGPPLPSVSDMTGGVKDIIKSLIGPTGTVIMEAIEANKGTVAKVSGPAASILGSAVPTLGAAAMKQVADIVNPATLAAKIQEKAAAAALSRVPTVPDLNPMKGGGASDSSGPIIAGTLSAIVLAGSFKAIADMLGPRV